MDIIKEPIHYQNQQLCLKVWTFLQEGHFGAEMPSWHYHKEVEFILVLEGVHEMHTLGQAYRLEQGDVMVIGSNQLHRAVGHAGHEAEYIVLHVDLEPYFDPATINYLSCFLEVLQPLDGMNDRFAFNPDAREAVGRAISSIHEEVMAKRHGYEVAVSMHIKALMLTMLRHDTNGILSPGGKLDAHVLKPIIALIDERLGEKIHMAELSALAGMSYVYFSKYFKAHMGLSFTEYVNRRRIAKATRLLALTDRKITDIAYSVGLENMAHFYEMFKRFNGCTPKQFKLQMVLSEEPD
ncbi:AraC family transcriptional regulator [Paenibacillus sp. 1011MAR3C5]|uniref:helix-turn-helix transcriptional regulator n=1 Tax=Paenibacillus sp. 1011MAR3C5 TaxID=1675787 RepID=UPI000E6BCD6F|nr:AraC family transcriptional regulator [Paenibacillus sp. 1011MAR3C5]RJE89741.1 AraC family transcriptional regulator [Paenibacillus sp. 1011MAR3C5]